jgi:hypothetical protein
LHRLNICFEQHHLQVLWHGLVPHLAITKVHSLTSPIAKPTAKERADEPLVTLDDCVSLVQFYRFSKKLVN